MRLLLVAPMLLFVAYVATLSVNVPVGDDYVLLRDVVEMRRSTSIQEFMDTLLAPRMEHRLVLTRTVGYLESYLPSGIDFRLLEYVGVVGLLAALLVLGLVLELRRQWVLWALVFLAMLQPEQHKLMFYAMASVQAYFGLLVSLIYTYFLLHRRGVAFTTAALVGAALIQGSWIVLPVLGCLVLAARGDWRGGLLQAIVGVLIAVVYLAGDGLVHANHVLFALGHPWETARLFLGILGSVAEIPFERYAHLSAYTTVVAGALILGYTAVRGVHVFLKRRCLADVAELRFLVIVAFAVLVTGLIAVNRVGIYSDDWVLAALDGRYRLYGLVACTACLVDAYQNMGGNRWLRHARPAVLAGAMVFSFGWYILRVGPDTGSARTRVDALQHWLSTGDPSLLPSWANSPTMAGDALTAAVMDGIFRPSIDQISPPADRAAISSSL
jgi:hypothetical protein